MKQLTDLQALINEAIDKLAFPQQPADLYEPISYILTLGGKRLRPALLLMACDLFGGDVESAVQPALAIEVFHNFTLMHDDIMDNAPLRRGQVTVHEKWNANVAILSGDAMMVESNKLMMRVPDAILRKVMDVFNETATGVCEGQQIDMSFEQRSNVIIEEYLNMIRLKTAVLLGGTAGGYRQWIINPFQAWYVTVGLSVSLTLERDTFYIRDECFTENSRKNIQYPNESGACRSGAFWSCFSS